jgi:Domain of unknown function (DUF6473)
MNSTIVKEHLSGYQSRDREVIDYQMYQLADTGLSFRGPELDLASGEYFTCVGAAQTFGCFCPDPYPSMLAKHLGIPALNLGYGGAGPEFFNRRMDLDRFINGGRFVVVQVMSGRSQSNSMFSCGGLELLTRRDDGKQMAAATAYRNMLDGPSWLRRLLPGKLGRLAGRAVSARKVLRLVDETRAAWVASYQSWLSRIEVPIILFWFSKRTPEYRISLRNKQTLFAEYPQLINQAAVEQIRHLGLNYVECISDRGSPQPLKSQFTGKAVTIDPADDRTDLGQGVWTHNRYYPSPEMHEDAVARLEPIARKLLLNSN